MLSTYRERRAEEGFTLIELLVVIIIIGILAAIAIPTFLSQREKGWEAAVKSDLRNAAVSQESYFTDNGTTYATDPDDLGDEGFNPSDSVVDFTSTIDDTEGFQAYCMSAQHEAGGNAFYITSFGGEPEDAGDRDLACQDDVDGDAETVTIG